MVGEMTMSEPDPGGCPLPKPREQRHRSGEDGLSERGTIPLRM